MVVASEQLTIVCRCKIFRKYSNLRWVVYCFAFIRSPIFQLLIFMFYLYAQSVIAGYYLTLLGIEAQTMFLAYSRSARSASITHATAQILPLLNICFTFFAIVFHLAFLFCFCFGFYFFLCESNGTHIFDARPLKIRKLPQILMFLKNKSRFVQTN